MNNSNINIKNDNKKIKNNDKIIKIKSKYLIEKDIVIENNLFFI